VRNPFLFFQDAHHLAGAEFAPADDLVVGRAKSQVNRAEADILATVKTTASLAPGGSLSSNIGRSGDADWVRVSLTGGVTYVIEQKGSDSSSGSLADPFIKGIYNSKGRLIIGTSDDDSGVGADSKLTFTPTADGVYYVSAAAYGKFTGSYTLSLSTFVDTTAPTIASASPADNATNVAVSSNVVITFSESIQAGSGNIVLTSASGTRTISVTDATQVQVSGDQLIINPTADLAAGESYTVQVASGAVRDLAGNAFAGSSFDFTTASSSGGGGGGTWNIMVYIAGDNDLEGFGVGDVNEMESVRLPAGVTMSVLFDRSPSYDSSNGNWSGTRQGLITYDGTSTTMTSLPTGATVTEVNTGSGATLTNFINWADAAVNADHNMLVVWNHGGGLDGVAWDYSSGYDYLNFNEIKNAIDSSTVDRFDVVGFDACLMAMAELVYDLTPYADYVVASQELEPGDGWDYAEFIRLLQADASLNALDVALATVNSYPGQYGSMSDITLSAVSTNSFSAVTTEMNQFVASALALSSSHSDWAVMRSAASTAREYPSGDDGFGDLGHFMALVSSNASSVSLKTEASQVLAALDTAVVAEVGTVSQASGLSIYLPPTGITSLGGWYSEASFGFLAGVAWDDFLYRL
jgi:methionine-rich copper-binding protein CopC